MAATQVGSNAVVIYGLLSEMVSPAGFPLGSLFVVESGASKGLEYSVGTDGEWFQRNQLQLDSDDNSAINTLIGGAITAVSGNPGLYPVDANAAPGSGDGATEFITDVIGYKGFTVDIQGDIEIGLNESLMVTYSTLVSNQVNNAAILDSLRTNLGVPNAVNHPNSFVVTANTKKIPAPMMQNGVRIKTISVAAEAGNKTVVISTIE